MTFFESENIQTFFVTNWNRFKYKLHHFMPCISYFCFSYFTFICLYLHFIRCALVGCQAQTSTFIFLPRKTPTSHQLRSLSLIIFHFPFFTQLIMLLLQETYQIFVNQYLSIHIYPSIHNIFMFISPICT